VNKPSGSPLPVCTTALAPSSPIKSTASSARTQSPRNAARNARACPTCCRRPANVPTQYLPRPARLASFVLRASAAEASSTVLTATESGVLSATGMAALLWRDIAMLYIAMYGGSCTGLMQVAGG
jgi:hypothetical protein